MDYFPTPSGSGQPVETPINELIIGGASFPWQLTVISQYANSSIMMELVAQNADALDASVSLDDFYAKTWNIETAEGYGLDVWGRIVGVSRYLQIAGTKYFGFEEGGSISYDPFNQAPFYSGQPLTSVYRLLDGPFRQLIMAKAAANIWDGSIRQLNQILTTLFPSRVAYVVDNQDMTMVYKFGWLLNPIEASIIITSGVLPRPSGVDVTYEQTP